MYPKWRPFFREDRDVDDYTSYGEYGPIRFNPELESSVEHILQAILDRGGVIHLAFLQRKSGTTRKSSICPRRAHLTVVSRSRPASDSSLCFAPPISTLIVCY